jgi:putative DNA primase/helicase
MARKTRAGRTGSVRGVKEWRTLFLSTGEIGLADKLGEDVRSRSVARRFALLAVAGELGIALGVLPWPEGEATAAVA